MPAKKGITPLEIIITIGIFVLAAVMIGSVFSSFSENSRLIEAHSLILGALRDARSKTLSSQSASNHGVHFQADKAVVFQGNSYNSSDSANENYILPAGVEIGVISLSGGASDIVFTRLQGTTTVSGSITIRMINNAAKIKTITIFPSGIVQ